MLEAQSSPSFFQDPPDNTSYTLFRNIPELSGERLTDAIKKLFLRQDKLSEKYQMALLKRWSVSEINLPIQVVDVLLTTIRYPERKLDYRLYPLHCCSKIYDFILVLNGVEFELNVVSESLEREEIFIDEAAILNQLKRFSFINLPIPELFNVSPIHVFWALFEKLVSGMTNKQLSNIIEWCLHFLNENYWENHWMTFTLQACLPYCTQFEADAILNLVLSKGDLHKELINESLSYISPFTFSKLVTDLKQKISNKEESISNREKFMTILEACVIRQEILDSNAIVKTYLDTFKTFEEGLKKNLLRIMIRYVPFIDIENKKEIIQLCNEILSAPNEEMALEVEGTKEILLSEITEIFSELDTDSISSILAELTQNKPLLYTAIGLEVLSKLSDYCNEFQLDSIKRTLVNNQVEFSSSEFISQYFELNNKIEDRKTELISPRSTQPRPLPVDIEIKNLLQELDYTSIEDDENERLEARIQMLILSERVSNNILSKNEALPLLTQQKVELFKMLNLFVHEVEMCRAFKLNMGWS